MNARPLADADAPEFGVKARRLARLISAGLPTPPGLALAAGAALDPEALAGLEAAAGARLAEGLLLAVRASPVDAAAPSPPAILNVGLTETCAAALGDRIGARGAAQLRCRALQQLGAAMGVPADDFEATLYDRLKLVGADSEDMLQDPALHALAADYLALIEEVEGARPPTEPAAQLALAVDAMRAAWDRPRARALRAAKGADPEAGLGLVIQVMALGLGPEPSGAGVARRRSEQDGAPGFEGRYLPQAQGDDVLMGLRTPRLLTAAARAALGQSAPALEETAPEQGAALRRLTEAAERALGDACAVEFTVEAGRLSLLDAQPAAIGPRAAIRVAVDLAEEGAISRDEALLRVDPLVLNAYLHPTISETAPRDVLGRGLPASPGAATGPLVFSADAAEAEAQRGRSAILARMETSPEDIRGMHAAAGVLTVRGGMTSHAAVIARGLGTPCVVGANDLHLDLEARRLTAPDGRVFGEGDVITVDGGAGEALSGAPPLRPAEISGAFETLMDWADQRRRLKVRANADTAQDARVARQFNVDGIGLCRTEHMFFDADRIVVMRQMILAETAEDRRAALDRLLPMQRGDFAGLFEIMAGLPVTIRLLDPPLHEFLPHGARELEDLAAAMGLPVEMVIRRAEDMAEFNPMLGKRGCRVGVAYPEIYEMQARAVLEAAAEAGARTGAPVTPEIMIPLVSAKRELDLLAAAVERVAEAVRAETGAPLRYRIGAMVETPRAALRAGDLAATAEFLSFGTNDLTQMTYGLSRDDAGRFMRDYVAKGVFPEDPFHTLDPVGVGELLLIAAERGRAARADMALGLCGEHGGDPASIGFCAEAGFDYVSCSPFRAPIARLSAAQAAIRADRAAAREVE